MNVTDLYVRITDENHKSHIEHRRAWDPARLYASLKDAQKKEGGDVELSNEVEYKESRVKRAA